jgi:hypothetical protein
MDDDFQEPPLIAFVRRHMVQGDCKCGKCIPPVKSKPDPTDHAVNMVFFFAAMVEDPDTHVMPTVEQFKKLTAEHQGSWDEVNPFDGGEHNYLTLGGWMGDQGTALLYMAMGVRLGVFTLLTPWTMMPKVMSEETAQHMAGMGMVSIVAKPSTFAERHSVVTSAR